MAAITETVTAITKMIRGQMEAVLLNKIVGQPNLNSVRQLVEQIVAFVSHFATIKWGYKHGLLPLLLREAKMRLAAGCNTLNCERLSNPKLLKPNIKDDTKGREILQIQEEQKVQWQECNFQEVV